LVSLVANRRAAAPPACLAEQ